MSCFCTCPPDCKVCAEGSCLRCESVCECRCYERLLRKTLKGWALRNPDLTATDLRALGRAWELFETGEGAWFGFWWCTPALRPPRRKRRKNVAKPRVEEQAAPRKVVSLRVAQLKGWRPC